MTETNTTERRRLEIEWKRGGGICVRWGGLFDTDSGSLGHAEPVELARRLPADVAEELADRLAAMADALLLVLRAEGRR